MTLDELQERLGDFRASWCRSQKSDRDLEMLAHMCYVVGVEPHCALVDKRDVREGE